MSEKEPNNSENQERVPEGREMGEKLYDDDFVVTTSFGAEIAVVLEPEKIREDGTIPAYTWIQNINVEGEIVGEPRESGPTLLTPFTAKQFQEQVAEVKKETE